MKRYIGGSFALVVVVVVITTFSFGVMYGASVAGEPGLKHQAVENVSDIDEEVRESIERNSSGWIGDFQVAVGTGVASWAEAASIHGINAGYRYPFLTPVAHIAPFAAVLGGLAVSLYRISKVVEI